MRQRMTLGWPHLFEIWVKWVGGEEVLWAWLIKLMLWRAFWSPGWEVYSSIMKQYLSWSRIMQCVNHNSLFKGIISDSNSIFLWHKSEDINIKVISKISVDSNFPFTSYAWLCALALLHQRLLCWIKSCQWDFMQKKLSFHKEMISD